MTGSKHFLKYFDETPIDRTCTMKYVPHCQEYLKIDLNHKTNLTFEELVKERVEIIKASGDIILMWSGGIDSTLVLYALIEANCTFDVLTSKDAEEEYPEVYNQIMSGEIENVKEVFLLESYNYKFVKDKVVVSGEIGDQLMGSMKYLDYSIDNLKGHYKNYVPDEIIENFDTQCQSILNDEDATLAEYLWSMNFIFKYISVIKRMFEILDSENKGVKIAHFFHSKDFQAWSIATYKDHCDFDTIEDYKKIYKQYIFDRNNDIDYYNNKLKEPSLKNLSSYTKNK